MALAPDLLMAAERDRRILIIEPYDDIRQLVEALLRHAGHEVKAVADGRSAIAELGRGTFACVVVGSPIPLDRAGDVLFLEYIEQHVHRWRPAIIVLTATVDSTRLLGLAERLDAWAVFAKPFSPEELVDVVNGCVEGRRPANRWYGIPRSVLDMFRTTP